jgi:hypothetical protein
MTKLVSFNGDENLKKMMLEETVKHRKADAIVQGRYGDSKEENFKGCAVGCAIHSLNARLGKNYNNSDHSVYEKELGLPEWLARIEDTIFEGLPVSDAKKWPEQFIEAIPVGVNLESVKWKFCAFILKENIERTLSLKISDDLKKQVVDSIRGVLSLHENAIETGVWNESAAESARSAARSAAESAAESARSAAESAYKKYAKELLTLLKNSK